MSNSYIIEKYGKGVLLLLFNATFNDISVISWRSVLLETGVDRENHQPAASQWQVIWAHLTKRTHNFSGNNITGTDCDDVKHT